MNIFETIREDKDTRAGINKNLADAAVAEAREKIKDQILFLKENSKDLNIRHHLKEVNKDNKDDFLKNLSNKDVIDFNEVILKGNWQEYLEKNKTEKLTKYEKEKVADQNLITPEKDMARRDPAEELKLSFRAMINHYARNLEIEGYEKKKETERQLLRKEFMLKLEELEKSQPHIAAEIKGIDPDIFRKPDYQVVLNLSENSLSDYENGLKKYFNIKLGGKCEENPVESKVQIVEKDPRFRYYCALKQLVNPGPCEPHIFINEFNQNL
jgi:hypothetical protein